MRGCASDGSGWSAKTRDAVLIHARVTVVAHAGERVQVHRELERRQLVSRPDLPGGDLVNRGAQEIIELSVCLAKAALRNPALEVSCVPG